MLYGVIKKNTLIVAAADTLAEFENFSPASADRPDEFAMMGDAFFSKLPVQPFLFEFDTVDDLAEFARVHDVQMLGENRLASKSKLMKSAAEPDPYAHTTRLTIEEDEAAIETGAKVTIASLHGIVEQDRWDARTDAEKEQARKNKEEYDKSKKEGRLSGDDSFSADAADAGEPVKKDKSLHVSDVRINRDSEGGFTIDNVIAVKGLYENDQWTYATALAEDGGTLVVIVELSQWDERKTIDEKRNLTDVLSNIPVGMAEISPGVFKTASSVEDAKDAMANNGFSFNPELSDQIAGSVEDADNDDPSIDPKGVIAIYFKMSVFGAKLNDVIPALEASGAKLDQLVRRNCSTGCWVAFIRKSDAEQAGENLAAAGFTVEVYGVDDHGARLVAEGVDGVSVVDTSAPTDYGPRAWNGRASEIQTMDEAALKAHKKSMKGEEFFFCAEYAGSGRGTTVHIVPTVYFIEHGSMFPENLNIGHLLPDDFSEIEPGVFRTMGRDLYNTLNELAFRRKFAESMRLQLFLNMQD